MVVGEVPWAAFKAEKVGTALESGETQGICLSTTSRSGDIQLEMYLHYSQSRMLNRRLELAFKLA